MKKIILLAAFLLAGIAQAQDAVTLNMQLLPNKKYDQVSKQDISMEMVYNGSEAMMNALKSNGMENPTVSNTKVSTTNATVTKKAAGGKIPVTMKMDVGVEMKMKGMPDNSNAFNIEVFGNVKEGEIIPVFDSINAPGMPAAQKEATLEMITKMQSQISFPEKTLKIGESFVQEMPLEIPAGAMVIKMNDVITYKLTRIENRKAYFNVLHAISLGMNVQGQKMKGSGSGSGEMVYDMDNNYPIVNNTDTDMNMSFMQGEMEFTIKMKTKSTQTTAISAN